MSIKRKVLCLFGFHKWKVHFSEIWLRNCTHCDRWERWIKTLSIVHGFWVKAESWELPNRKG